MPSITFFLFFVWVAALLLAIWALRVAQIFVKRGLRANIQALCTEFPAVAVILPIKGMDEDTAGNVEALLNQDYPNYRLIFAVEAENDPVTALLARLAREHAAGKMEVVVAGLAESRGQKIHNQLAGVERTTEKDEILAFMDADAKPGPNWLHALVTPLTYGPHIGASTGYRFYIPASGHKSVCEKPGATTTDLRGRASGSRNTATNCVAVAPGKTSHAISKANAVLSVINAGVAALFGPYRRTFAWGGSMAIRRPDFFGYGLQEAWQHALSDDYVLSHCVRDVGKAKIHFVPQCLVASDANFTWRSLFEFAVRQYRITRICEPLVWLIATAAPIVYLFTLAYCACMAIYSIQTGASNWWHFIMMFAALYIVSAVRGAYLMLGGAQILQAHAKEIWRLKFWYTLGFPLVQAFNLLTLLAAAAGRRIVWRGVAYTMVNRKMTVVHRTAKVEAGNLSAADKPAELITSGK